MKRLVVHREAELELWQAVAYYESKSAGLGLDLEYEVRRALADIQEGPGRWPARECGTSSRLLQRFPYVIHYLELQDTIWIVSVAHISRRPDYWRDRLEGDR